MNSLINVQLAPLPTTIVTERKSRAYAIGFFGTQSAAGAPFAPPAPPRNLSPIHDPNSILYSPYGL